MISEQFDPQLVEKAKTETEAFGQLYDFFFPKVYAFVMAKVRNTEVAEDLVSDIFMKLLENLHKYEERNGAFAGWLFTVARNQVFDHFAKNNKRTTLSLDETIEVKDEKKDSSPQAIAQNSELKEKVALVLEDLPEREKSVVQMKFFVGLNNREIAAAMNLTESNVGVILYRILRKIKPELNNFF